MTEREYYLAFSLVSGIGPKTFLLLLKYFKSAKKAWSSSSNELNKAGLSEILIRKFEKAKVELNLQEYKQKLKLKKVSFLALCDKNYPKLLAQIPNPPIVLYFKGDILLINFEKTIGVVGTRKITNYGREVTNLFSTELAQSGFTVVSGLAMGVDAVAASSAMEASGKTIAVLGNGVDLCFPSSNEKLYDKILDGNGIIVSEFPLGQSPSIGSFPSRNRIIAGLSLGVLVTEGAQDSGSLITADYAFKFSRKVFAIPGPITSSLSVAPLKLIEKGAVLVTSASDITKIINSQFPIFNQTSNSKTRAAVKAFGDARQEIKPKGETREEQIIINCLENEGLHFDEIARKTNLNTAKLASILSMMEIKGYLKNRDGLYFTS